MIKFEFKLGFVFTNYNNSQITRHAIESISMNESYSNNPIVVVDNNSDNDSIEILKKIGEDYNNVSIIYNKENIGYFKGLNEGIKLMKGADRMIEYIVIGNNDLIFPENFIDSVHTKCDLLEINPVISPNIITMDGIHQNPHVIKKISKFRELIFDLYFSNYILARTIKQIAEVTRSFTDRKDEDQHEVAMKIYQGYGACYILTPVFFKNFSELWAPTFLMGEEFFLSKQLESKHFQVYYEPSILVNHQCHSTMGKIPNRKVWEFGRESHRVYRKYVGIWK